MNKIEININQIVKVKLSKEALERKQKEVDGYNKKYNLKAELSIDEEGYYSDQLWSIMKDFGDMMEGTYCPISDFKIVVDF